MIWILIVLAAMLAAGFFLLIAPYNSLVKLRNQVQESWRQVDVELNRRYDLIPNLVETVKGYATHEHNTLEDVVSLRNRAQSSAASDAGTPSQARAEIEAQLTQAVTQFLVVSESYPELKANENFRDLQRQLVDTEDRISNGRRYYNAVVGNYNTLIESFPSNLSANAFKFEKAGYFEITDPTLRVKPEVKFDQINYRGSGSPALEAQSESAEGNLVVPVELPEVPDLGGRSRPVPRPGAGE